MRLCYYIIKEDEPHSENSTLGFPAEGLGRLSPTSGGGEGRCHRLLWRMAHRWLSSTSFPTHACQKLLGLNAHVSVPYYRLFNIQELALNKYVSNYVMCLETIWLVPKCLGDKSSVKQEVWVISERGTEAHGQLPVCSRPDSIRSYSSSRPWQGSKPAQNHGGVSWLSHLPAGE